MSSDSAETFALIDGNNFYVSCERVFQPRLEGRPVVVLSNNDGCVVARSQEVKAMNVPIGLPWFQLQPLVRKHGIVGLSSNYELYGDLSRRMMAVIGQFSPEQEVYSIDETFLNLSGMQDTHTAIGQAIRKRVRRCTGIPTAVGIGNTKTLAKLANVAAKKRPQFNGVCDFNALSKAELEALLISLPVNEVWGVGRQLRKALDVMGVVTSADLRRADAGRIREKFGVVLERTVRELQGLPFHHIEDMAPPRKQIISSRSFGVKTDSLQMLTEAISMHVGVAAEKLRRQTHTCGVLQVFLETNPFRPETPQHYPVATATLKPPTDDTLRLTRAAIKGLKEIYRSGFKYMKGGVMLVEIQPRKIEQNELFGDEAPITTERNKKLMLILDTLNTRSGRGTLRTAAEGVDKAWTMKRDLITPHYTTRWSDLPTARAK